MTAYNCETSIESAIEKCIEGFAFANKIKPSLVIVDDGSTDRTPELLQKCVNKFGNQSISLKRTENFGSASARNTLLEMCKSEFVFFMDSDDLVMSDKILLELEILCDEQFDLVQGQWSELHYENGKSALSKKIETDFKYINLMDPMEKKQIFSEKGFWRYIYRTEFIKNNQVKFFPTFKDIRGFYILDDYYFLLHLLSLNPKLLHSGSIYYKYDFKNEGFDSRYLNQIKKEFLATKIMRDIIRKNREIDSLFVNEIILDRLIYCFYRTMNINSFRNNISFIGEIYFWIKSNKKGYIRKLLRLLKCLFHLFVSQISKLKFP